MKLIISDADPVLDGWSFACVGGGTVGMCDVMRLKL